MTTSKIGLHMYKEILQRIDTIELLLIVVIVILMVNVTLNIGTSLLGLNALLNGNNDNDNKQ